jgi:hypothetical protein
MTKFFIIAAIIILFKVFVETNYATTREKQEVVDTFDPIAMIVMLVATIINVYLGYSMYAASEMMPTSNVQEVYSQGPIIIALLAILPVANIKGNSSFIHFICNTVWICCFMVFLTTFMLHNGLQLLTSVLSIFLFKPYSLAEEFAKHPLLASDDIFFQAYEIAYPVLIILSTFVFIRLIINLFTDNNEEAWDSLISTIGYLTGLLLVVAAICYIKGEIIWNDSAPTKTTSKPTASKIRIPNTSSNESKRINSPYVTYDEDGNVGGEGGGVAGAKARTKARKSMRHNYN